MSVRVPCVAGRFYEAEAKSLLNYVQTALNEAQKNTIVEQKKSANLVFLPHAGHFFCGHVIAQTLAHVVLPQTLIVLGPNHTGQGAQLSVWHEGYWQTPLGNVPINTELAQEILQSNCGFQADTKAHLNEHSLEVILPFLQVAVPNVNIVPIAVGGRDFNALKKAGYTLGSIIKKYEQRGHEVSIVLSSDLHHFSDHNTTIALDELALQAFMAFDALNLAKIVGENSISMCGICPAVVSLYALENTEKLYKCTLVNHTTSFEMGGDSKSTVGYAGLFVNKSTCQ